MERQASRAVLGWAALSACLAALAYTCVTPGVLGLFHDDGVYAVAAKALADHGQYRTASVPGEPFQTKYPPLYPLLLSLVWRVAPAFPRNVLALKALNVAFVAVALLGVARLARSVFPGSVAIPAVLMLLLAASPSVLGFADFTMSDVMFLALVVWALALGTSTGDPGGRGREALVAGVTAAAILTRSVGVTLGAALFLDRALRRRWREAALHGAVSLVVFGAWAWWGSAHRDPTLGPLVEYYQSYERTALGYLRADPGLARSIVIGNLRMMADAAHLVAGPSLGPLWPAYAALGLLGAYRLVRAGASLVVLFAALYLGAVAVYPFAPHRYLMPVAPVLHLAVLAGGVAAAEGAARRVSPVRARLARVAVLAAVAVPLVVGDAVWLGLRAAPPGGGRVRSWYGAGLDFEWSGFEEAFRWIRDHTAPEARVASIYDPMYFLYTDRQSIRPWRHRPETYFYPYGHAAPSVGSAREVAGELDRLGVDYVVLDPPEGYTEGVAVTRMLRELVALPEVRGALAFTTRDGRHEIYRLWNGRQAGR